MYKVQGTVKWDQLKIKPKRNALYCTEKGLAQINSLLGG